MKLITLFFLIFFSCGKVQIKDKEENLIVSSTLECQCSLSDKKICGKDGITYINDCVSSCYKVKTDYQGACTVQPSQKVCIEIYSPVCGYNGITYSNSCTAKSSGITTFKDGSCL